MSYRLTPKQRHVMLTIRQMQLGSEGCGHDAEGDLSICTGNLTRVLRTLYRNGLIEDYDVMEPDGYYTEVRLTRAGFEAIRPRLGVPA
jgi:DNA-binding MarR family transcriptional regulator